MFAAFIFANSEETSEENPTHRNQPHGKEYGLKK